MLFEAAALLTASLALAGVGAPVPMPEYSAISVLETAHTRVADRQGEAGTSTRAVLGLQAAATADVDASALRSLGGSNLLVGMSRLPLADLTGFAARHPAQIDTLLSAPPEAGVVSDWWSLLDSSQRASLAAATPRLVGNLDGVPLAQRSRANESYLRAALADAHRTLAEHPTQAEAARAGQRIAMLTQVSLALRPSDGGPKRSLILLDTSGSGRAAIALGNPDTADYLGYLVPGMNYQVEPQMVNWTGVADDVYREQSAVLPDNTRRTIATIAWIGYEAPDVFSVGGRDRAVAGATFLETSWAGVRASRGTDQPFISVFAHSYGSTVSLMALANGSVEVDALVLVGSPGSEIQSADRLQVTDSNVFVGKADWDVAVSSAFFGSDPGASSYGARALGVSGATDTVTGAWLERSLGHNDYFRPGSESLHNMALIGTDNADLATDGDE